MQLTSVLLYQSLKEQFHIADYRLLSQEQPLARPFFYEPGLPLISNHIYLTDETLDLTVFQSMPQDVVFVICQKSNSSVLPQGNFSTILLSIETSVIHVFNCIQSIFDHYENWEAELISICQHNDSLEDLLQASTPIFHNPMLITSADYSPIASCNVSEVPVLQEIFTDSSIRMHYVNAFTQDAACQLSPGERSPVLFPDYITGYRSLNLNLFLNDRTEAEYLLCIVEYSTPLSDADRYLITILAQHAEYVLHRMHSESSSRSTTLQSIFQSLLSDRTADYLHISKLLAAVNWLPGHAYFCAVIQTGNTSHSSLNPRAVCKYVQETFPASCSILFQNNVVSFFNLDLLGKDADDICQVLVYFIRDSILKAGYSRTMLGHMNLRRQYLQASTALRLGSQLHPQLWIHHFNHVALPYILRQATKTFPGYMLCYEKLLKLQECDSLQGTEYMHTLKVYLEHNLNTVRSAKSLYIHRSTFLYRMDRIKCILETDLEDPEELFYLNLSFRLLENDSHAKS